MEESNRSFLPLTSPPPPSRTIPARLRWISRVFWGPNGLRSGWRLLVFLTLCVALFKGLSYISGFVSHDQTPEDPLLPGNLAQVEITGFGLVFFATWIMSKLEGRQTEAYGFLWARLLAKNLWIGLAMGFAAITTLLGALRATGAVHMTEMVLHGADAWKYGLWWAVALMGVACFEEAIFRGYALFTLTTGIGFWPAAIICSAIFGYAHGRNPGETWIGEMSAAAIGLFFCLLLRRTGSLWMPIGFHASWDWGETFFYGVPDSGQVAPGHLFNATVAGPAWLSGGMVGPEGSCLCLLVIAVLAVIVSVWLTDVKYPDPLSIRDPRE